MNRIEWPILSHSDPIQFSQVPPLGDGRRDDAAAHCSCTGVCVVLERSPRPAAQERHAIYSDHRYGSEVAFFQRWFVRS